MISLITIRQAVAEDVPQLVDLFSLCFGFLDNSMFNIDHNHYFVAVSDNRIVAVSGIVFPYDEFNEYASGYEISWTCTRSDFRRKGLASSLVERVLDIRENKDVPVYCSCLRVCQDDINLRSVMDRFGFRCLYKGKKHIVFPYHSACFVCVNYGGQGCECFEDVYVLS